MAGTDTGSRELSLMDKQIPSLLEICLNSNLYSINLHCNQISKIEGLRHLCYLQHLDLSSNLITKIEGLDSLASLQSLNLSCNKLTRVQGLEKLFNLKKLNLSYNSIRDLTGLIPLHGWNHKLSHLYLHSNCINSTDEVLQGMIGLNCLLHLTLEQNAKGNPVCHALGYREIILENLPQLNSLDGLDRSGDPVKALEGDSMDLANLDFLEYLITFDSEKKEVKESLTGPVKTARIDEVLTKYRKHRDTSESINLNTDVTSSSDHDAVRFHDNSNMLREMRIKKLEDQISELLVKASCPKSEQTKLKAKRDTDFTTESDSESTKENRKGSTTKRTPGCRKISQTSKNQATQQLKGRISYSDTDVHTVASLFKLYLRELPEPAIPWRQYEDFLSCEKLITVDEEKGHRDLMNHISILPKENYNLLCFICRFLFEVQKNSGVNKMSVDNLSMVIGVNLLKPQTEDPEALMRSAPQIQKLMTVMISRHEKFFPKSNDLPEEPESKKNDPRKVQLPRSSVGWDAAEEIVSPGAEQNKRDTCGSLGSSTSEDGLVSLEEDVSLLRDTSGSWKAIPRKRTQTLPITNLPMMGKHLDNNISPKGELLSGEFWSSPLKQQTSIMSSSPGHKRTLSEELECHRRSTYDNVPCLQGESGPCSLPCKTTVSLMNSGEQKVAQQMMNLKNSINSPGADGKQYNGQEMPLKLMELQREWEKERKELEERIQSLEKENYDTWKKVVKLHEDLEKEKNQRKALEITLQNADRSRDDAEKRNKILEQEIQGFVRAMALSSTKPE